jgi:hypothetical protein
MLSNQVGRCFFGVAVTEDDGEFGGNLLLWIHDDKQLFVQKTV